MKRKDVLLLVGVLVIAAAVFLLAKLLPGGFGTISGRQLPVATANPTDTLNATETQAAQLPQSNDPTDDVVGSTVAPGTSSVPSTAQPLPTLAPAPAYLSVQMDNLVLDPIPLTESRDLELPQPDGKLNVVRVTTDSIVMHSSTCENQDCIHQGMVTLDNRGQRVLGNAIICLPNKVILMLLTPQEAQRQFVEFYQQ